MPHEDSPTQVRAAAASDAGAIAAIYGFYVENSAITFEEVAVSAGEMAGRIADTASRGLPWFVAVDEEEVVGFAYAAPWKPRSAYRFSVEVTVYLAQSHARRGVGTQLYTSLLAALRELRLHTAIAGITTPNPESVQLHRRFGFQKVAHFRQVGFKLGRWVDVEYWQLHLDPEQSVP